MRNLKIHLAISPCPNDTFLYEGLVGEVLAAGGRVDFLDIAELNAQATVAEPPDALKVSCASAPLFLDRYRLLRCGGAFADAVGPLVLAKPGSTGRGVCLPGRRTTAHILWRLYAQERGLDTSLEEFERFDKIPPLLAGGRWARGVVIHESRFTFRDLGLVEEADLGVHWDRVTGTPVPLGCLLVKRSLGAEVARQVAESVVSWSRAAMDKSDPITPFVSRHAAEMDPAVQRLHIETYATRKSLDCGEDGLRGLGLLWDLADGIEPWTCGPDLRRRALDEASDLTRS